MAGPRLLVSVRSANEVGAALAGGADLIDVKEPSRGPLGQADSDTIAAVIRTVGSQVPVSAALGELRECLLSAAELPSGLQYIKWGLSELSKRHAANHLADARGIAAPRDVVAVAYADSVRASAPPPAEVIEIAIELRLPVVLFDTFQKDGSTLLDWLTVKETMFLVRTCRDAGVKVAPAGSLTAADIDRLRDAQPDWFAVRGAACDGGRGGTVSERRVRELADLVHSIR